RLQAHLGRARMARCGSRLAALSGSPPPWALLHGRSGGRRSTGVGGVLGDTGFGGCDALQEGEDLGSPPRGRLWPILRWDTASLRQGGRIKQQHGAHDAVSSDPRAPISTTKCRTWPQNNVRWEGWLMHHTPVIRYVLRPSRFESCQTFEEGEHPQ